MTTSRGVEWATLGPVVRPKRTVLFSEDNANTRFQLLVEFPSGGHRCVDGAVVLGTSAVSSNGYGSNGRDCSLSFQLDATLATSAARVMRVARQDRRPAGVRVQGTFAPSAAVYRAGQLVEIVLTLQNPVGAPRVLRHQGGRQRGPRDNQFSFRITRDGQPVPEVPGMDFGGLGGAAPFDPGQSAQLRAPLDRWGDVSRPGHYVVECAYETQFSPDGARPYDDADRGAIWDRSFQGRITFDVR
jgi:hypothetical protein